MAPEDDKIAFYPAFCFQVSLTHFAWVKMRAADVHRLKAQKGFEGKPKNFLPLVVLLLHFLCTLYTGHIIFLFPDSI
jgi:hypothetical protein